jgi:hypothetical protein
MTQRTTPEADGEARAAAPPQAPTACTFPARTAAAPGSSNGQSFTDHRRGDLTQIRLPGLMLCEQRIRRAIRGLRELPLTNGYAKEQLEKVLSDLHIAIDAIQ